MRIIKPQRISIFQRAFEVRGEKLLSIGLTAYTPFDAPDLPLPEISMWQELPKQAGQDVGVDEGLPKPRGEVLVFGKAFAPGGKPRTVFRVRVRVGDIDKALFVVGKRHWVHGAPSDAEPLTELALGWDKAFGGPSFLQNPLGMGVAPVEIDGKQVHQLPHLEDPDALMKSPKDRPTPMALGPIDPAWPQRMGKLGTYDAKWLEEDFPGFARDLDPDYFMLASDDQRLPAYFQGGEPIEIENLHPEQPRLQSRVTSLIGRCFATKRTPTGEVFEEVATRLETVILLPNVRRMVSIFRGVLRVTEDDAADVTCLLLGLELRGAQPKPVSHYREVLARRLDKKKGHLVALRDRDLVPAPDPSAPVLPDERFSDMDELLAREGVMEKRAHTRAQKELDNVRRSTLVLGIDPDEKGIPREVPPPEKQPNLEELADYMEALEKEVDKLETQAKAQQDQALAQAREELAQHGVDLDEQIERSKKEGGGPPKFRAADHLAQMRETARLGREMGAPMDEFEAKLEDPAFITQLESLEATQLQAYRTVGHHLPPASQPTEEAQQEMRARVMDARSKGVSMKGWDLTGADLSGLDLSGTMLEEALLEGADLRGCLLTGTNLTGAVLARANLTDARLGGARLEGANLGFVQAQGADFEGALMKKAVLWHGMLDGARLRGVDMRGADVFEANLAKVDMTGAIAEETLFFCCNFEGAQLDRARLHKAIFFRCRMPGASLQGTDLSAATIVELQAPGANMRGIRADNTRLVNTDEGQCDLSGADLTEASLGMSTLRGVNFQKAVLSNVRADGCDLSLADMRGARLDGASLRGARLMRTDLADTDLTGANLMEAMLQGAKLGGTQFVKANLFRATLMGAVGDGQTSFRDAHVVRTLYPRRKR